MNKVKKLKKKMLIGIFSAVMLMTAAGVSLAYLTQEEQVVNVFTVGDLELGLKEPEWEVEKGDGTSMVPGSSVYKNPTIKNITSNKNGEQSCYARVYLYLKDKGGTMISDPERLKLIKNMIRFDQSYTGTYDAKGAATQIMEGRVPGYSKAEIDALPMINPLFTQDTIRSTENVLVYNYMGPDKSGIMKIGDQAALFTTLAVPTDWNKREMTLLGDFQIEVKAQAIQSTGFAKQEDAYKALDDKGVGHA